jgi:hypothetical protein
MSERPDPAICRDPLLAGTIVCYGTVLHKCVEQFSDSIGTTGRPRSIRAVADLAPPRALRCLVPRWLPNQSIREIKATRYARRWGLRLRSASGLEAPAEARRPHRARSR